MGASLESHPLGDKPLVGENDELGEGTGRQGPWAEDEDDRAAKQEGDPEALDVDGDPRGGLQSDEYRHADPREIVVEGDTAMTGPAGAPQDGMSIEERKRLGDDVRRKLDENEPRTT